MMSHPTISIVNRKGMVTIPSNLRKKYNLQEGSEVAFLDIMGNLVLVPILSIEEIRKQMPPAKEMLKSYEESRKQEIQLENKRL
ncbi:MAG: AbrB/MazE/SpoVT family DNA-binding domain-containing protein [Candidatus Lokiarchaeota archaeon]|nr:AbrB/MazE/SpoVT family DNA-binding domain-containing protein [Candidatus Lokiarchaeota archaeon]